MADGILSALQAALMGIGGGIEGAQQYRQMERKRQMEQDAINYQRKRDVLRDAESLRQEQRQAVAAGMLPADQYNQFTAADMPGATPRQALRQKIGEQEFVYAPSVAQSQKHRLDILEEQRKRTALAETRSSVADALAQVESGGKRLSQQQINTWSKLDRPERTSLVNNWIKANESKTVRGGGGGGGASTKGMPSQEELMRSVGIWNSLTNVPDEQLSPEEVQFRNTMIKTFDRLRGRGTPQESKAPAEQLIFQAVAAADAQNKRLTAPPKPPAEEDDGLTPAERLYNRRRKAVLEGKGGQATPAAPAATPAATPAAKTLEQEFPGQAAQIAEARRNGHTDQQIRQFLSGRR